MSNQSIEETDINEGLRAKGFFRLNIVDADGSVAGDSGWVRNAIQDSAYTNFLIKCVYSTASTGVTHIALGTSTQTQAATAQTLGGEVMSSTQRTTYSYATSSNSRSIALTATFASGFVSGAGSTLANIGLFNSSSGGTMFAHNTYTGSACASNQAVNVTYTISFT